jgi:uncharacterized protein (DUF305 family)
MKRRAATTGIAVGSVLMAMATVGVAVADANVGRSAPVPTPSGPQQTCPGMPPGMGPGGPMNAVNNEFDYLAQMIPHHQEAVTAAEQLRRSARPEMRRLGESIATTQSAEIEKMKAWLAQWYPGRSTEVTSRPMMRDLSGLSGDALDKAFLQDMIWHHMMAVMMSQQLLMHGNAEHPEVMEFARTVRDTQHAEMFQMRQWLVSWFGEQSMPCIPGMPGLTGTSTPIPTGTGPSPTSGG